MSLKNPIVTFVIISTHYLHNKLLGGDITAVQTFKHAEKQQIEKWNHKINCACQL